MYSPYLGLVPWEDLLHTRTGLGILGMQKPSPLADSLSQDSLCVCIC